MQIGRTRSNAVYIKDPTVSQKHARLEWTGSAYTITDLGSSNGTTVNEREIDEGEPCVVEHGDVVVVGTDTVVKVSIAAAPASEAEAPAKQARGAAARAAAATKRAEAKARREEAAAKAARAREAKREAAAAAGAEPDRGQEGVRQAREAAGGHGARVRGLATGAGEDERRGRNARPVPLADRGGRAFGQR